MPHAAAKCLRELLNRKDPRVARLGLVGICVSNKCRLRKRHQSDCNQLRQHQKNRSINFHPQFNNSGNYVVMQHASVGSATVKRRFEESATVYTDATDPHYIIGKQNEMFIGGIDTTISPTVTQPTVQLPILPNSEDSSTSPIICSTAAKMLFTFENCDNSPKPASSMPSYLSRNLSK
ncbi:hypothetical protein GJ496_005159 [Pomphorhynchus laevis]|nr:hypothetical protein GJ496_005159 [Pomphorhynchus laevis]